MDIVFAPDLKPFGVVSSLTWQNADLQAAITQVFRVSPREYIKALVIDRNGIAAVFGLREGKGTKECPAVAADAPE